MLAIFLIASAITLAVYGTEEVRNHITDAANSRWGFVAFVAVYAIAVVLLLPGTIGTLIAGAIFGFPLGAFAAVAGATIGSTAAYFISRALGREGANHLIGERLTSIDEWIGKNDFTSILVLRLMPLVPFNALNYAAGLANVRPSRYIAATIIGLIPGAILTTAVGDMADDPTSTPFMVLMGVFAAMIVGSVVVSKRIRRT